MNKDEFIAQIKDELLLYSESPVVQDFGAKVIDLASTEWPDSAPPAAVEPAPAIPAPATPAASPGPLLECIDEAGFGSFFDVARNTSPLGPDLSQNEVDGCIQIIKECCRVRWPLSWVAYGLATAYHETAGTMLPIREYGKGNGRPYGVIDHNNQIPYGRGYVQLTHTANYEKMDQELGLNGTLIANYDLALDPNIASKIMIYGMEHGSFTGKSLQVYLPVEADIHQFSNARRVINVLDKAVLIAGYALKFQSFLKSVWRC